MSAYVISELEVRDPATIETYRTIAAKSIAQYGGRYLVRNGAASVAEGGPLTRIARAIRPLPASAASGAR
jgi:uncharacterized protein (DUF1330 family)